MLQHRRIDSGQMAARALPGAGHMGDQVGVWLVGHEIGGELGRDMSRRLRPRRQIVERGMDRADPLQAEPAVMFAEHRFARLVGALGVEDEACAGPVGQSGEKPRQLAHVGLAIGRADAERVQLHQLAAEVLVQPALAEPTQLGVRASGIGLVEIDQHHRMGFDGLQHRRERPGQMRPDRVFLQGHRAVRELAGLVHHGEMIGPEHLQPLAKPGWRRHGPLQQPHIAFDALAVERVAQRRSGVARLQRALAHGQVQIADLRILSPDLGAADHRKLAGEPVGRRQFRQQIFGAGRGGMAGRKAGAEALGGEGGDGGHRLDSRVGNGGEGARRGHGSPRAPQRRRTVTSVSRMRLPKHDLGRGSRKVACPWPGWRPARASLRIHRCSANVPVARRGK